MKKTCETCGGSGQTNYFKGVSRFLLSIDECPECSGLGFFHPEVASPEPEADTPEKERTNRKQ